MTTKRKTKNSGKNGTLSVVQARYDELSKRVNKEMKTLEKRVNKELKTFEKRARKNATVVRFEGLFKDLDKQVSGMRSRVAHAAGLASVDDIDQLNQKLSVVSRKLNGLVKNAA